MITISTRFIFSIVVLIAPAGICHAQTIALKPAPANVIIDGNAAEWGDDLPYNNDKAKVNYILASDKHNLYMVIKTKDTVLQGDILGSGITFSIDTKDKKSITFPVNELDDETTYTNLTPTQTEIKTALTKYRKIGIEDFKGIDEEQLSTLNPYGIQIAIGYDVNNYLIYEEAVPLTLFDAANAANKEWPFTIKINGLKRKRKAYLVISAGYKGRQTDNTNAGRDLIQWTEFNKVIAYYATSKGQQYLSHHVPELVDIIVITPSVEFKGKFVDKNIFSTVK